MLRNLFAIIFVILFINAVYGQSCPAPGFGIETNFMAGKIIRHSSKFTAPIPPLSVATDLYFSWQTYGKKEWQQRCNFPKIGVGVTYTNYGNNRVFGQCIGVYPSIQVPIWHNSKLEWSLRIGNGISYVSRNYQNSDTINTAIGSHINDFAIFMSDVRLHINDHWHVQAGVNFTHISNGDFQKPNLGVNMAGAHVGVQYYPGTCTPRCIIRKLPKVKDYWVINVRGALSYKEARAKGSPILPKYIGSAFVGKRFYGRIKAFAGIDYAYHKDVYAFLKNYGVHNGEEKAHSWDGAFFAGGEYMIGNLGIVGQVGVYYRQTFLKFVPIYEKFGGNYYILKRSHGPLKEVFLSAMLMTHGIVAEYSEYGIGVGF